MNSTIYIPIIVMWIIILIMLCRRKVVITKRIIDKRKNEGDIEMKELAVRFIEKECMIYAFDSTHVFKGIIKEVTDGAVLIETNGTLEAINLDFVIRIREFPKNKSGKKKTFVFD